MNVPLQTDTIANTIAGRLTLIRENDMLRAALAKCRAERANLERRILELTHERDAARAQQQPKPGIFR
jgi:BMFP domain-containing protein YqiC